MKNSAWAGLPAYYNAHPKYREFARSRGWDLSALIGCRIKLLMVADNADFTDANNYNLSEVIRAITDDLPSYLTIDITTAEHHSGNAAGADIQNLNFANHDLKQYDQIWFFAVSRNGALADNEVEAIWDFMQGGGGVFATGDHDALGVHLCGKIPRVRSMRRWYWPNPGPNGEPVAPDAGGNRLDTSVGSDFDGTPQTIHPKLYSAWHPYIFGTRKYPHPVLCSKHGRITVLPDHMHEGLIEVPNLNMPISVNGNPVEEYPTRNGVKLAPEVIAEADDHHGGGRFGVIGAYDGHLVDGVDDGVGRVVVDATWHHFFNMNVNQFRWGWEAAEAAINNGMTPSAADAQLAAYYRQIRAYFQNIAIWLARKRTQRCIARRGVWLVAHHLDVQMSLIDLKTLEAEAHIRPEYYLDLGTKAKDALQQLAPQCQTISYIFELIIPEWRYKDLLDPWIIPDREIEGLRKEFGLSMLDADTIETMVMGAALHQLNNAGLRMNERSIDGGELDKTLSEGAGQAIEVLAQTSELERGRMEFMRDAR